MVHKLVIEQSGTALIFIPGVPFITVPFITKEALNGGPAATVLAFHDIGFAYEYFVTCCHAC